MALLSILRLPFRVIKAPVSIILIIGGFRRRRDFSLPVAGLHEAKAQSIYFTLRRAATTPDEEKVGLQWLAALQVVQIASARILTEMDVVEANLHFWTQRLDAGSHFWFTLFRHGPISFVKRLAQLIRLRKGGRAGRLASGRLASGGGATAEANVHVTDLELVEKRVLIFRLLRGELCEAAEAIQRAGALLYLQQSSSLTASTATEDDDDVVAGSSTTAVEEERREAFFLNADTAISASMAGVAAAFHSLSRGVHATLEGQQQGPEAAASADRRMLTQALGRVLGVGPLRRIWTHQEEIAPAVESAAAVDISAEGDVGIVESSPPPPPPPPPQRTQIDSSTAAQRAIGFAPSLTPDSTVHGALIEARNAAMVLHRIPQRRLVTLPDWMPMPSQLQQNWVRLTVLGIITGYGTLFVVRHSRLTGSRDLDDWIHAGLSGIKAAWAEHVIGPLERVRGELFNTFRRRPAIVSMEEYEADRDSLQRMLDDFKIDFIKRRGKAAASTTTASSSSSSTTAAAAEGSNSTNAAAEYGGDTIGSGDELLEGMELMMRSYEMELKKPIKNLLSGDLMRSLLIQVQKLKVDTESAMLEIDQILRANELSISLVAAVPAFLIAGAGLFYLGRALTPAPPDPQREAVPARMAMIEVERALESLSSCEEAATTATASAVVVGSTTSRNSRKEASGMFIYRLAVAYSEAETLFRRHRGVLRSTSSSEWNNLRGDLLELASPAPATQKLRTAARMMRVYAIYQQF